MDQAGKYVADAVLGIDTLWGGDVMCPSGTGRFIADSWFSDEPLPAAYTHPGGASARHGGVAGKKIDREAVEEYLRAVDLPAAIAGVRKRRRQRLAVCAAYLTGWRFVSRQCGTWPWRFSAKAIRCLTRAPSRHRPAKPPEPSRPEEKRETRGRIAGPRRLYASSIGWSAGGGRCLAPGTRADGLRARTGRGCDRAF